MTQPVTVEHLLATQNELLMGMQEMLKGKGVPSNAFNEFLKYKKDVALGHTGTLLHGPGGLFNTTGLESDIISTHVRPRGLGQLLPAFPSNSTHPYFGLITGFSDDIGAEPVDVCDDAPAGYIKSGTLTSRYGRVQRGTNTINMSETLFQSNSGETMDLQLIGSFLGDQSRGLYYPNSIPSDPGQVLDMVTAAEMVSVGVRFERKLHRLFWTGDGSGANDTPGGGYKEFAGLDSLIATGYVDAELNVALPSADSVIRNFSYQDVTTTDLVAEMERIENYMWNLDEDTSVGPVNRVIVMRPMLWETLCRVWPVQYNTQVALAILSSNAQYNLNATDTIAMRDRMRESMLLTLNGRTYNVVTDTGIVEQNNGSGVGLGVDEFASSIYFVPLSLGNGFPTLYWQYLDFTPITNIPAPANMLTWWTDGGKWKWAYKSDYDCFKMKAQIDPRLILRTPHLAAKLQNVKYSNSLPYRDPDPTSDYWVNGGVSTPFRNQNGPTQYAPWL